METKYIYTMEFSLVDYESEEFKFMRVFGAHMDAWFESMGLEDWSHIMTAEDEYVIEDFEHGKKLSNIEKINEADIAFGSLTIQLANEDAIEYIKDIFNNNGINYCIVKVTGAFFIYFKFFEVEEDGGLVEVLHEREYNLIDVLVDCFRAHNITVTTVSRK